MEVLDELNETLELSGAKLGQTHARLPLYRAPVWTGRSRGRTASASTGTMPSASSAGASMR